MYKSVTKTQELRDYIGTAKVISFDFETAPDKQYRNEEKAANPARVALDSHKSHIVGISFSVAEETAVYIPLTHKVGENVTDSAECLTARAKCPPFTHCSMSLRVFMSRSAWIYIWRFSIHLTSLTPRAFWKTSTMADMSPSMSL
jgi:DNA polymerase I-like protein with 3'-5' exonuclease and polymerase domains